LVIIRGIRVRTCAFAAWRLCVEKNPRIYWPWWKKPFSALFIAAGTRFNSSVANLHIQPIQSLDAPELALYQTLRRVEEHERAGVLVASA
jgi:hypothetical protein